MVFSAIPDRHPTFHVTGLISRGIETYDQSTYCLLSRYRSYQWKIRHWSFKKKKRRKKEASRQRTRARVLPTRGESLAGSQSRVRVSTCTWLHLYVRSMHTRMPRLTVPYEHRGSFGKIAKFLVTSIMLIVYWSDITRIEDFTYSALVEVNHFCFRVGRHR